MDITIVTWNVNSIKARLPNFLAWLGETKPDIVLLQETKTINETFPAMEIEDAGYNIAMHGQKTYNGVAILSKFPLEDVVTTLPGDDADEEARYIEALVNVEDQVIRVASVYVPNGKSPDSDRFIYKLNFFDRLQEHLKTLLTYEELMVIGGDYNVAPQDIDVYNPDGLRGTLCFHPDEQAKFNALLYLGLTDAFRAKYPDSQQFSWWDYRGGSWQNNKGMRIDHLLLSPQAADTLQDCATDDKPRGKEKASDHAPVWCRLALSSF